MRRDVELRTLLGRRRTQVEPTLPAAVSRAWTAALRRGAHDTARRWGLHALSLLVVFGAPYVHGRWRAHRLQALYAEAAACVYGGTASRRYATGPVEDPAGFFSSMVLKRGDDWPARCTQPLQSLAEDPARFVFPTVKEAEVNVQKAAQLSLTELRALPLLATSGQRIPVRPLWALELLRTAVAALGHAAGAESSSVEAAISFSALQTRLPTPTLLNIDAAPDASVKVWGGERELQVAAFDQRGVSYLRLSPSDMTRARLPRSGSLRSVVTDGNPAYLVWATPLDKCAGSHCAGKSLGLSTMPVPLTKLPEPHWVAAHPFGSPPRSLAWQGTRIWMAAAKLDGTAKLVEFDYTEAAHSADDASPLVPESKKLVDARDLVVFTDSVGELGALALVVGVRGRLALALYRDSGPEQTLVTLPAHWTSGWIRRCSAASGDGDTHYFVLGNATEALIGYVRAGATTTWPSVAARIPRPPSSENPTEARVALACASGAGVTVAYTDDERALDAITCAEGGSRCSYQRLSDRADGVDVTYSRGAALVAYSAGPDRSQVRLRALDTQGSPRQAESSVPAPCWERWGGLCGAPSFAWVGTAKLVLAARSGADLMAVESRDGGDTWHALDAPNLVKPPGPHVLPRLPAR